MKNNIDIILASKSEIRIKILKEIGLNFRFEEHSFNEDLFKNVKISVQEKALKISEGKAMSVSKKFPNALVIGCDQICEMEGKVFSKPGNYENCLNHLQNLQGKTHNQNNGITIACQSNVVWQHFESAKMSMRPLSSEQIMNYIELDQPFSACGAYRMEANGKILFEKIEGSDDCIKGLPTIPLLNFLIEENFIKLL